MDLIAWLFIALLIVGVLVVSLLFLKSLLILAMKLPLALIRRITSVLPSHRESASPNTKESPQAEHAHGPQESIAEKILFWEQQDQINQELIPRVIRQNELLTQHIRDHENLPQIATRAVRDALDEAKEEQLGRYQTALAAARSDLLRDLQSSMATADDRLSASIDLKMQVLSRKYRLTLHLLIGTTIASGLVSVAALILAVVL